MMCDGENRLAITLSLEQWSHVLDALTAYRRGEQPSYELTHGGNQLGSAVDWIDYHLGEAITKIAAGRVPSPNPTTGAP